MDIEQLEKAVIKWAEYRGLLIPENDKNQFLKTIEEIGEISRALLKDNQEGVIDGIGDVMVTLIILAEQRGTSIGECLHHAYMEIKDRKGRTINGTFIKN